MKELIGQRFGKLTVTEYAGEQNGMHRWRCQCECGNETVVGQSLLQSGKTKSCGCLLRSQMRSNIGAVDGSAVSTIERYRTHLSSKNSSGYNGVYFNRKNQKWIAQITFRSRTYYLGSYDALQDAVDARRHGEEMHDQFLSWYYETYPGKKRAASNKHPAPPLGGAS